MPTYAYACKQCGHRFDAVQSFADAALTVCPECGGPLRKEYGSIGVTFNGSGFYRTDSRAGGSDGSGAAKSGSNEKGSSGSGSSSSGDSAGGSSSSSTSSKAETKASPAPAGS
ncbi:MAG: FmdB family transcriptional regulator [Microbacterium sp.]|uniref:FmdB family zinc ribbon protein n=1 Tax=Microbacterium sp. TaxID=51671 RepID=UPI001AC85B63|nr:FmdB family zinc ribbon protein [Microbacterium sp.]MBN9155345.1 FmdB family transcriptional regulator [Microbacterium sp.]MBN9170887.1 FmdB family transcriptional regulator [Microbacterium sp.]MBN9173973.1 FmdB family transcriptional regulator [Microbacterium sp.]MBN9179346.1 FmdB family transcriptional regulator [Microbacterium sp.]MBN9188731.1 FmdB family transcriptional regulator [Microbacterium sp.]